MTDWIKNLKVGDKVMVECYGFGRTTAVSTSVLKITPTGRIRVAYRDTLLFNERGHCRRDDWESYALRPWTTEKEEQLNRQKISASIVRRLSKDVNFSKLSLEKLERIVDIIDEKE